ncbi:hypothetical protein [Vreelandella populi]|uniref:hypothetical protein n=1 Tax=Vreelandella populi TaxID=2498858 RepID=UPI000F8C8210|nr:hypothetical protein [Halomonas populi]RUR53287.1 hypothetical protein ELY40_14865 [Halomonas populi]
MVDDRTEEQRERFVFNYENAPEEVIIQHLNSNDDISATEVEQYDDRGNMVSNEITNASTGEIERTHTEYSDSDLPEREVHYNPDGSINWVWVYKYDEADNKVEEVMQVYNGEDDYVTYVSINEYDENNNIVSITSLDEEGRVEQQTLFEYLYDDNNNWITKRKYTVSNSSQGEDSKVKNLAYVWERQIDYYGSVASAMRNEGCIFLRNTLKICENETLESLEQHTNRHIRTKITIPVDDNEFMSERVYGVALEVISDEPCVAECMDQQISTFTEEYLSRFTAFSLNQSEQTSIGDYSGTLLFFNNENSIQNFQAAVEGVFLTQINDQIVSLSALYVYNIDKEENERIKNEIKKSLELNLEEVSEV